MGGGGGASASSEPFWGAPRETSETKGLDNEGILSLQKRKMDEQDELLDVISESVDRTKEVAIAIGDEAEDQIGLLRDLDRETKHVTGRVGRATDRVRKVSAKSSTTILWLIIAFLMVVLGVVLFLAIYF